MTRRLLLKLSLFLILVALLVGFAYLRYINWPSFGGAKEVRVYLPEEYPVKDAHHYTLRSFMDTWELYRFTTTPDAINFLVENLNLESHGLVYEFPLIVSKPPPYWWNPELLREAEYFSSRERAPDGRLYDLLYSMERGIVYLIRFDG